MNSNTHHRFFFELSPKKVKERSTVSHSETAVIRLFSANHVEKSQGLSSIAFKNLQNALRRKGGRGGGFVAKIIVVLNAPEPDANLVNTATEMLCNYVGEVGIVHNL